MHRWLTLLLLAPALALGATVNWLDSGKYLKPAPLAVAEPAAYNYTYYADLSGGGGNCLTPATYCSWSSIAGKPGTTSGGPTLIYLRGTGAMSDISLIGAGAGSEIVVKPWDDSTTATVTGRNNWSGNKQWVIFDGGPNMQLRFNSTSNSQFDPSLYFSSDSANQHDVKFYRLRFYVTSQGLQIASWGNFTNFYWINCEFTADAAQLNQQHHVYLSGGAQVASHTMNGIYFLNNIFRNTAGEAIELRSAQPGNVITNVVIDGNAFHDVGVAICTSGWKCRSAVTISDEGGGTTPPPYRISNNLIWNTGEGCLRPWSLPDTGKVYNNTCTLWGRGSNGTWTSAAFMGANSPYTAPGDYQNNVLYATGTDGGGNTLVPFWSNGSRGNNNACTASSNCGTSKQTVSAASFGSVDPASQQFMRPVAGATTIDHGVDVSASGITLDYMGKSRPAGAAYDIGAFEYGSSGSAPTVPGNPR